MFRSAQKEILGKQTLAHKIPFYKYHSLCIPESSSITFINNNKDKEQQRKTLRRICPFFPAGSLSCVYQGMVDMYIIIQYFLAHFFLSQLLLRHQLII